MIYTEEIPKTYEEAVEALARWHGQGAFSDIVIYAMNGMDEPQQLVRLVEVSLAFSTTEEPLPVTMGRSKYMPFRTAVILVSPETWDGIRRGAVSLPSGWEVNTARKVWPRDEE